MIFMVVTFVSCFVPDSGSTGCRVDFSLLQIKRDMLVTDTEVLIGCYRLDVE